MSQQTFHLFIKDWERIREHFSEPEKGILNAAIVGEMICPRGCVIDEDKAGVVGARIKELLRSGKP